MKKIWFYFFVSIIFFGLLFKMEYATDTYSVFNFDEQAIFSQYAMSGRFVTAVVGKMVKSTNLSEQTIYIGSYVLAIICAVFGQYLLYTIIEKNVENKALKLIIPILIIINPFSIELFMYIEKGIMWFGVLLCIVGVKNIIKYFETRKRKYILFAMLQVFIANCSYQGIVGIFLSISLVYIIKYSKNIKQFVFNNFLVGIIYIIPALIDILLVKVLYKSNRLNGKIIIFESLNKILKNTIKMFITTYDLMPKYVFILLILFTFTLFCCKIWKEKRYLHVFRLCYIVIGIVFIAIAPQIVQPTDSIWFVPRTTYSFSSLFGILVLYLVMNYELERIYKISIIVLSCSIILFQAKVFIKIERDRFLLNEKDEEITMQIIEQMDRYEKQTGKKITKVSVYQDNKTNYTYDGIFATGDMNIKCYFADWSTIEILKYYSKKDLKLVQKDEKLEHQFKEKDWNRFNMEQIIFKDNTINICNY